MFPPMSYLTIQGHHTFFVPEVYDEKHFRLIEFLALNQTTVCDWNEATERGI